MDEEKKDKLLQDQRKAIVELGEMIVKLSLRVYALEAILQKSGSLPEKAVDALAEQFQSAVSRRVQLNSLEKQKEETLERLQELLSRFEGPIQ